MSGFSRFDSAPSGAAEDRDGSAHRIKIYKALARLSESEAPAEDSQRTQARLNEAAAARHPRWRPVEQEG